VRYFIELQYDGAAYCGWQRQPDAVTVQGVIEEKLSMLLRVTTEIVGAGRTDTGVNASFYIAHFDAEEGIDTAQLCYKMNKVLPMDIAILSIEEVPERFHSRFSAKKKTYIYRIHTSTIPDVFARKYQYTYTEKLDIVRMKAAANPYLRER
jgi:tRNA pseudouridine38-40 synthase